MKKIKIEETEQEQAKRIQRDTVMKEVAWESFCWHYTQFHEMTEDDDPWAKTGRSDRALEWMQEYRSLTKE